MDEEQSVTHFTDEAVVQRTEEISVRHERITLSERDFVAFVEAINVPAEPPTERLLADVAAYKMRQSKASATAQ